MYSGMTSLTIQSVPDTMVDLAMHSDMPYTTTTRHQYKGKWYSTLKDMFLADIVHVYKEGVMKKFLRRFRHNLFLADNKYSESEIIYNISAKLTVSVANGYVLPSIQKFALVSIADYSAFFVGMMKKYTDYYVIASKEDSLYVSLNSWYGKRNQVALMFSNGISKLEQSGIYIRWDRHFHFYEVIRKLSEVDRRLNVTLDKYFGFVVMAKSKLDSQNNESAPLSWNVIDLVFLGCALLLGIAVAVFILEAVLNKICNRRDTCLVVQYFEYVS